MARPIPVLVAVAAAAALTLTGCSGGSGSSQSSGPVTLTFWGTYGNGGNSAQTDMLQNTIIPAFEKANPGITINYVDMPYDSLQQKLTTGAAAGDLPDLVRADIGWVPKFGSLKVFAPLDQVMPDFQKLADDTYPGSLATNKFGDHYYGLPLDTNTRVLISNPDALAKAASRPRPRRSTSSRPTRRRSRRRASRSSPTAASRGGTSTRGSGPAAARSPTRPDEGDGLPQRPEERRRGADARRPLQGRLHPEPDHRQQGCDLDAGRPARRRLREHPRRSVDGGDLAGPVPQLQARLQRRPGRPRGSISVVGGEDIVMTTASKNQDAAAKFIAFTQTADYQINMAKTGQMSVVKSLDAQEQAAVPAFAPFITQLATAKPRPSVPQASAIDSALQDELTKAFQGTETVQQALDNAAAAIDPLLTKTS